MNADPRATPPRVREAADTVRKALYYAPTGFHPVSTFDVGMAAVAALDVLLAAAERSDTLAPLVAAVDLLLGVIPQPTDQGGPTTFSIDILPGLQACQEAIGPARAALVAGAADSTPDYVVETRYTASPQTPGGSEETGT